MAESRPQSHGNAISMENSLELSTTLVCLYQQQEQQEHFTGFLCDKSAQK